ncbi:Variant SH3 domain containing protein [Aphelenchoides fujianensis]|nr:Variant SH3 domain containing protein [Aphelenchoides fujianensis]
MGSCVSKPRDPDLPGNTSALCPAPALNPAHPISSSAFPANVYKPHSQLKLNESSLTESPRRASEEQVIALFPYTSRADGDLSFQKGDVMILLESTNTDWWYVRTKDGKRQGYVPRNFVAVRTTVESEEWFAGPISRSQAERLVLSGNMPAGTFLVRQRDVNPTEYALTIRDRDTGAAPTCKHYRIKLLDNNEGFYITPRSKFKTLKHLVRYYSDNADGLCTILSFPAPRLAPVRPDLSSETQRSLVSELENYKIQLQQVEAALIPEPDNEELLKLREDLNEIIRLQEELIGNEKADTSAKGGESSRKGESSAMPSREKISWKVGDRCLAPSKNNNNQRYAAIIDGISQDKVAVSFIGNGVKHMVRLSDLRVAPVEEKKNYIFDQTPRPNTGPKKEWQMERERRKLRAQKKEVRRKELDAAKESQKNKWLNFNNKATHKSLKGIKRIEASSSAPDGPAGGLKGNSAEDRPSNAAGRPIDSSALVDPRSGRMVNQNVYRGSSLHRHGSMGVASPSMFHVNGNAGGDFFNGLVPNNPRIPARKVQAMYDYESRVEGDISFRKGDVMILMDDGNADWWYVVHPQHGSGYCPQNFVALIESLDVEEWFVGKIQRSLAEKLVSAPGLPRGTFLVRQRDSGHEYALTINDSQRPGEIDTKHYKIRPLDANGGYYITTKKVFASIRELIHYYSQDAGGLCHRLTYAAPRVAPTRPDLSYDTQKNWEIPREDGAIECRSRTVCRTQSTNKCSRCGFLCFLVTHCGVFLSAGRKCPEKKATFDFLFSYFDDFFNNAQLQYVAESINGTQ